MLSHYSALLWVATLGIYGLMRLSQQAQFACIDNSVARIATSGALALAVLLYVTHISKIKKTTMAGAGLRQLSRHKSYFHAGHDNPILFLLARTFSVFQFMLGQSVVGDIAALLFMAGIVLLWRGQIGLPPSGVSSRQLAILLTLPFIVNCVAAFRDAYPYGGTRHSVFLVVFGLAGVSLCLVRIAGGNATRSPRHCAGYDSNLLGIPLGRHPYIDRADQNRTQMERALRFVHDEIPCFRHYFCGLRKVGLSSATISAPKDRSLTTDRFPAFLFLTAPSIELFRPSMTSGAFDRQMFSEQWRQLVANASLKSGDQVWASGMDCYPGGRTEERRSGVSQAKCDVVREEHSILPRHRWDAILVDARRFQSQCGHSKLIRRRVAIRFGDHAKASAIVPNRPANAMLLQRASDVIQPRRAVA